MTPVSTQICMGIPNLVLFLKLYSASAQVGIDLFLEGYSMCNSPAEPERDGWSCIPYSMHSNAVQFFTVECPLLWNHTTICSPSLKFPKLAFTRTDSLDIPAHFEINIQKISCIVGFFGVLQSMFFYRINLWIRWSNYSRNRNTNYIFFCSMVGDPKEYSGKDPPC